jgi:uncharacterized protein YdhG (YjbR/CyaY superfamily)
MPVMLHYDSVDAYINAQAADLQPQLTQLRQIITKAAPDAEESISYGMPAYKYLGKPLVYFAANKKHIGFYALPTANEFFKKELAGYDVSKGTIRFPLGQPLPVRLVSTIVKFRIEENKKVVSKKRAGKKVSPLAKGLKKAE